jgi:hypothetical protein
MPKGYRADGTPLGKKKEESVDRTQEIVKQILDQLLPRFEVLETKINDMESVSDFKVVKEPVLKPVESPEQSPEQSPEPSMSSADYIPYEYRNVVASVLNSRFGINVRYRNDAKFECTIVVPKEYSPLPAEEFKYRGADLRTLAIDNAMGKAGVQDWAERVFKNFNPETRAQIKADSVTSV